MKIKQTLSVLFFLSRKRAISTGEIPIYIRVTIDGDSCEISLSEKIPPGARWNNEEKKLNGKDPEAVRINTRITWAKASIQDHFLLLGAQHDSVTAAMLKKAFLGVNKLKEKANPAGNAQLSADIDRTIVRLYKYLRAAKKEPENDRRVGKLQRLDNLKEERKFLDSDIGQLEKQAARVFDDADIPKTMLNAMDEQLFMMICKGNKQLLAMETLRRWPVTKNKLKAFLLDRYLVKDLLLSKLEFKMAGQFYDYLTIKDWVGHNAAMKHVKNIKQIIDRAVTNGWVKINPIKNFKCTYKEPNQEGIVMADIHTLINTDFGCDRLNTVRDIFIFCCFTGYAYQDTLYLGPGNIITGIDGKKWIAKNREKTDQKEDVPLLRIPEMILEKYKNHPNCVRKGRLLPVKSNQKYNDYLKEISALCGIKRDLTSHIARHTFATTITLENDVPLPTVQKMLGHKSIRTTEKYAKATRTKISRNMARLNNMLFNDDGRLIVT